MAEIDRAVHYHESIKALPDFQWLGNLAMAEAMAAGETGRAAEIEEAFVMFEAWIDGRTLYPTL